MKRVILLSGFALWLCSCNADRAGTGGNPAQDSVAPATNGTSNDQGHGGTTGGSSDPANGGGPQALPNTGTTPTNSTTVTGSGNGNTTVINSDTSAPRGGNVNGGGSVSPKGNPNNRPATNGSGTSGSGGNKGGGSQRQQ